VQSLRAEKQRLEARGVEMEKEFEQTRIRSTQVDDALRMARQKLGDFREERSKHEIERARNDSEREHLRQSCIEELNAQPEDLIAEFPALLSGEELRAADSQYHEMKIRIESMGPVNMMALEEYNECEQRFGFLGRERDDLLQSITDTQQAITELDQVCKQKFEQAFAIINSNFATAFHVLFGGGTGEMRLSEPDSSGEPGIDVVAQPPGKRLQNVLLLSGGEKAMTALALLIAIFRYQPSPFCILDEVDAPLDEANVGRFTKLVSEMSASTQFIVVTHNRKTMEMATVLYGVTMQEPGVSKLVSVRWDEPAAEQAATNAA
jgi:chromosome segregation protein